MADEQQQQIRKPANFNFYLNTQGVRGRKGDKGDPGFAPSITIGKNTANEYTLVITTANGTFETENLRGSIITQGSGDFVKYNQTDGTLYVGDVDFATTDTFGKVKLANNSDYANFSETSVVTVEGLADYLSTHIKAGDDKIIINYDEDNGVVTLTAKEIEFPIATATGTGMVKPDNDSVTIDPDGTIHASVGTVDYNDVINKPQLNGKELKGDKKLSEFVALNNPLGENEDGSLDVKVDGDTISVNTQGELATTSKVAKTSDVENVLNKVNDQQTQINEVKSDIADINTAVDGINTNIDNLEGDITTLSNQVTANTTKAASNKTEIDSLDVRVEALEDKPDYTLPIASATTLGGIKIGENLEITEDGTLNAQAGGGGTGEFPIIGKGLERFIQEAKEEDYNMPSYNYWTNGAVNTVPTVLNTIYASAQETSSMNAKAALEGGDRWAPGNSGVNWLAFYTTPFAMKDISFGAFSTYYMINRFKMQGSQDGTNWEDITSEMNVTSSSTTTYPVNSTTIYPFHRIYITATSGSTPTVKSLTFTGGVHLEEMDVLRAKVDEETITCNNDGELTIIPQKGIENYSELVGTPVFNLPLQETEKVDSPLLGLDLSNGYLNCTNYQSISTSDLPSIRFYTSSNTFNSARTGVRMKNYVAIPYKPGQVVKTDGRAVTTFGYFNEDGTYCPVAWVGYFTYLGAAFASGDTFDSNGYKNGYSMNNTYGENVALSIEHVQMAQVSATDSAAMITAVYCHSNGYGSIYNEMVGGSTDYERYRRLVGQITHCVVSGFATNSNYYIADNFGLYNADGTLGISISPKKVMEGNNLFDITQEQRTRNVKLLTDNNTLKVNSTGQLYADITGLPSDITTSSDDSTVTLSSTKAIKLDAPMIEVGENLVVGNGDDASLYLHQGAVEAGENVTIDKTATGIRINSTGGGGSAEVAIATTDTVGIVKPDGETITVAEDGTISAGTTTIDYVNVINKPQINGNELIGNKDAEALEVEPTLTVSTPLSKKTLLNAPYDGYDLQGDTLISTVSRKLVDLSSTSVSFLSTGYIPYYNGDADIINMAPYVEMPIKWGYTHYFRGGTTGSGGGFGNNYGVILGHYDENNKFQIDCLIGRNTMQGVVSPNTIENSGLLKLADNKASYTGGQYGGNATSTTIRVGLYLDNPDGLLNSQMFVFSLADGNTSYRYSGITSTQIDVSKATVIRHLNGANAIISWDALNTWGYAKGAFVPPTSSPREAMVDHFNTRTPYTIKETRTNSLSLALDNTTIKVNDQGQLCAVQNASGGADANGARGDYCTKYGILDCPNGLIDYNAEGKAITINPGIVMKCPNKDTMTTIASAVNATLTSTGAVTLFYAGGQVLECGEVYFQEEEPEVDGAENYQAWWKPSEGMWYFRSNDTGNVFRSIEGVTPLADVKMNEANILRVDYIGYRILNDDIIPQLSDIENLHETTGALQVAVNQLDTRMGGLTLVKMTQDEYDALATKDANTLYIITE